LELGTPGSCRFVDYLHPTPLSDGRVAFVAVCHGLDFSFRFDIVALDLSTGKRELLASSSLPIARFSWNPRTDRGVVSVSEDICAGIAMISRTGLVPTAISVGEGDQQFRIESYVTQEHGTGCKDLGLADWPTWSPETSRIAFFASPESVGVDGFEKAFAPFNVYVMGDDELTPEMVLSGVRLPRGLEWSPDGRWLAFSGEVIGKGRGTWLLEPQQRTLARVTEISGDWLSWSPEASRLILARNMSPQSFPVHRLLIFSLEGLVG
jgi:Tol biopolymer transport system component